RSSGRQFWVNYRNHGLPFATIFPYTTLFRSLQCAAPGIHQWGVRHPASRARHLSRRGEFPWGDASRRSQQRRVGEASRQRRGARSEEHTSELQSPYELVCRLLLKKITVWPSI